MALTAKQEAFCELVKTGATAECAAAACGIALHEKTPICNFYVYLLIDPRDGTIFYIGKGRKDRMRHHARAPMAGAGGGVKGARIRSIQADGLKVMERVFSIEPSEKTALITERKMINALRLFGLTNIAQGVVTSNEAALPNAIALLSRAKTFEQWIDGARIDQLQYAIKSCGTVRAFYNKMVKEMEALVFCCAELNKKDYREA